MKDATSQLRTATRRFKSDVANKLVGIFLHEVSRRIRREWPLKVDGEEYERLVRERFNNLCPYCPIRRRSGSAPLETFVLGRICGFLEEEQRCLRSSICLGLGFFRPFGA